MGNRQAGKSGGAKREIEEKWRAMGGRLRMCAMNAQGRGTSSSGGGEMRGVGGGGVGAGDVVGVGAPWQEI